MKRIIALGIYAFVVIGGSAGYANHYMLKTVLYALLVILTVWVCSTLGSGSNDANMGGAARFGRVDLHYIKAQERIHNKNDYTENPSGNFDYVNIMTVVCLYIPVILSIWLFC